MLSSLLESFDSAGGGSIGYIRRILFVQSMLICLMNGSHDLLACLEEVCDCILNVCSDAEVGEEKTRILLNDRVHFDGISEEYLQKFTAQSNIQNSFACFLEVF